LVCLFVFASVTLASADLKVAVIDLGKAFDGYYKTKEANAKLQEKGTAEQKDFQSQVATYQQMGQEAEALNKAATDPTLSEAARADKAKALDAKKQDLINMQNKLQEMKVELTREIEEEKFRRHKEIVDEITKVINDYSGPQGFDIVIDKSSESASSGVPIVLYNSSKLVDITDVILKQLNATAPAPGTTPAPDASASSSPAAK
jgi:outer membrane protein